MQRTRRLQHIAQRAVDAKAHDGTILERLDVNVRGILAQRLRQQSVDQADDRRIVFGFEQIGNLRQLLREGGQVHVLAHVADELLRLVILTRINLRQGLLEALLVEHPRPHRLAQNASRFRQCAGFRILSHPQLNHRAVLAHRDDAAGFSEVIGQATADLRIGMA